MKAKYLTLSVMMGLLMAAAMSFQAAVAADDMDSKRKLVIQVSTDDARTQKIALNNAVNMQKMYGMDDVSIEIVAYGPGLSLLTKKNNQSKRVASLAQQNITFSACGNTMKKVSKKTGKEPSLTDGVKVVEAGVGRIVDLQMAGYSYIRP